MPSLRAWHCARNRFSKTTAPLSRFTNGLRRRPGTLFRALVLSEFGKRPVDDIFFQSNEFPDKRIADPFMGGGTPLIEANRVGCDVEGFDINPMAAWIVREEIEHLDLKAYALAATGLLSTLREKLQSLYVTDCPLYGDRRVPVKYWLWVKEIDCEACGEAVPLFPGYLLAEDVRHPQNVLVCSACGQLNEVKNPLAPGACKECSKSADAQRSGEAGALSMPEVPAREPLSTAQGWPPSPPPLCD